MTLQEASDFIQSSKNEKTSKSEIKIHEKFLHVIAQLKSRDFSTEEIQSLEAELGRLDLKSNIVSGKKHLKNTFDEFKVYLKEKYSLISKGYYTTMGVGLGAGFGVVLGVLVGERFERSLGLSLGISLGMFIGIIIGRNLDAKAMAEGRVY